MSTLLLSAITVAACGVAVDYSGRVRRWLHVFQLEHYEGARLLAWWRRRPDLLHLPAFASSVAALAGAAVSLGLGVQEPAAALLLVVGISSFVTAYREWSRPEKKPFVFTGRAKRLFAVAAVPELLFAAATAALAAEGASSAVAVTGLIGGGIFVVPAPARRVPR